MVTKNARSLAAVCGLLVVCLLPAGPVNGQIRIDFETYDPISTLVVPEHPRTRAALPFVDVHSHQRNMNADRLDELIRAMDTLNMRVMVNLSGGSGQSLKQMVSTVKARYPGRFLVFANIDFNGIGEDDWTENTVKQLEEDVRNGAAGLKIFKNLGFSVRDRDGQRVAVDDPRLEAIWEKCGELNIPVLIHTADPAPFWQDADQRNERWLELLIHSRRKRGPDDPAPWEQLIAEQHRMFKKHPNTTFIAAHFGWFANDLNKLDSLLAAMPNVMIEFGAVIAELGRQPRMARQFFIKNQDRILFGKDSWVPEEYATYFRVLETEDEYFPYHKKYHAFWRMYGLGLEKPILEKIYYRNALRAIPSLDRSLFPE